MNFAIFPEVGVFAEGESPTGTNPNGSISYFWKVRSCPLSRPACSWQPLTGALPAPVRSPAPSLPRSVASSSSRTLGRRSSATAAGRCAFPRPFLPTCAADGLPLTCVRPPPPVDIASSGTSTTNCSSGAGAGGGPAPKSADGSLALVVPCRRSRAPRPRRQSLRAGRKDPGTNKHLERRRSVRLQILPPPAVFAHCPDVQPDEAGLEEREHTEAEPRRPPAVALHARRQRAGPRRQGRRWPAAALVARGRRRW